MRRPAAHAQTLALTLRLGTAWDWLLGGLILFGGSSVMQLLQFPRPADMFLHRLSALPPLLFPLIYLMAANDPVGRPWAVRASILLRAVGGALLGLLVLAYRPPGAHVYLGAAAADLLWALLHLVLWGRVKRSR
jgi:hypothetical protein